MSYAKPLFFGQVYLIMDRLCIRSEGSLIRDTVIDFVVFVTAADSPHIVDPRSELKVSLQT
jgi:hypothetical protein